ncbi:hypothetical protein [Francisella philomiragia]|nr:hypothetical protein [Francisella philomiragia]
MYRILSFINWFKRLPIWGKVLVIVGYVAIIVVAFVFAEYK